MAGRREGSDLSGLDGKGGANGLLQVRQERSGDGVLTLAVEGELDLATAPQVREPLEAAIDDGTSRIVVDLRTCGFIDSTGLGVLLHAAKRADEAGGGMALISTDAQIGRLLELTMIDRTIPVYETREQALGELTGTA